MGLAKLQKRVGFIGAGQMAEALARGFISKGVLDASSIVATDPVPARKKVFESFDVKAVESNIEVVFGQSAGSLVHSTNLTLVQQK
jgi:pyrroline-5-carboxylate reductase